MNIIEFCTAMGCTPQQLAKQYTANIQQLQYMHNKAVATGKKVGNYTPEMLTKKIDLLKGKLQSVYALIIRQN